MQEDNKRYYTHWTWTQSTHDLRKAIHWAHIFVSKVSQRRSWQSPAPRFAVQRINLRWHNPPLLRFQLDYSILHLEQSQKIYVLAKVYVCDSENIWKTPYKVDIQWYRRVSTARGQRAPHLIQILHTAIHGGGHEHYNYIKLTLSLKTTFKKCSLISLFYDKMFFFSIF